MQIAVWYWAGDDTKVLPIRVTAYKLDNMSVPGYSLQVRQLLCEGLLNLSVIQESLHSWEEFSRIFLVSDGTQHSIDKFKATLAQFTDLFEENLCRIAKMKVPCVSLFKTDCFGIDNQLLRV